MFWETLITSISIHYNNNDSFIRQKEAFLRTKAGKKRRWDFWWKVSYRAKDCVDLDEIANILQSLSEDCKQEQSNKIKAKGTKKIIS